MDATGRRILQELQRNGRISLAELGRRVALSPPAVADRVRRLEQAGVITGYSARIDPTRLGLGVLAFIGLAPAGVDTGTFARRARSAIDLPEVLECHHVTGEDCYLLKVAVRDVLHLEALVERLSDLGQTTTAIVLSSPLSARPVLPIDTEALQPEHA